MARGRKRKRTNTNRASLGGGYAVAPFGFHDREIDQLVARVADQSRANDRDTNVRCTGAVLYRMFPPDSWKSECQGWDEPYRGTPMPAARMSARELSELSGVSIDRARAYLPRAIKAGWLVVLKPPRGKGAGRGGTPATLTLPHLARRALADKAGYADVGHDHDHEADHEADLDEEDGAPMICLDASLLEPSRGSGGIDDDSTDE